MSLGFILNKILSNEKVDVHILLINMYFTILLICLIEHEKLKFVCS